MQERHFIDSNGHEWEVFDDSGASLGWMLEWDYPPQRENPGLLFRSGPECRRLWPCPADWRHLPDQVLEELCRRARSLH